MNPTKLLLDKIAKSNSNPSSIQQVQLDVLEMVLDGKEVIDPSNAAALIMEMNATAVGGAINKSESIVRKLYPKLALEVEDLYNHISNYEMIDIFATPASTNINMLIPFENITKQMVATDNQLIKYLIIPRNYKIIVNGISFSVCYPIFINVINKNTIQTLYDTSENNPLKILTTNSLDNRFISLNNSTYLQITIPVLQYSVKSDIFTLSDTAIFEKTINFNDRFCLVRAYIKISGVWSEIDVTYSDKIYDVNKVTILVKVIGNKLKISLPLIYQFLRTSGSVIRIDTYTTLGILNSDLSQVPMANYSGIYENFDTTNKDLGLLAFKKVEDINFYSTDRITGGSNEADFNEIRDRTIYKSNSSTISRLPSDVQTKLMVKGYTISPLLDNITDRVYLAEKAVLSREIDGLEITPLTTNFITQMNPLDTFNGLYELTLSSNSLSRYTILKEALFKLVNGDLVYLSDDEIITINNLTDKNLCETLNNSQYFYTPFYTIIDDVNKNIIARSYYLDLPLIIGKKLNAENIYRKYGIVTLANTLVLNNGEYELKLNASVPFGLTSVNCQLTFYNKNDGTFIYLLADSVTITGNVGEFIFKLKTNFDINNNHEIMFTNFINASGVETPYYFPLTSEFNVFYSIVESNPDGLQTDFDSLFYKDAEGIVGATYESITLELGKYMNGLYTPINSYVIPKEYRKYTEQVFATYQEDVYERDENNCLVFTVVGDTIVMNKLHNQGDLVLTDGEPTLIHDIGEKILTPYGEEIPVDGSSITMGYRVGLTVIDARYRYANSIDVQEYAKSIPSVIDNYLRIDIKSIKESMAERTKLFYKPLGEPSTVEVLIGDGRQRVISSTLYPIITFYIDPDALNQKNVLDRIRTTCRTLIGKYITNTTISIDGMYEQLETIKNKAIIGFNVDQLLPNNLKIVTLKGGSFNIGEELVINTDKSISVKDVIKINFKKAI